MFERIVETAPGNRTLTDAERKALQEEGMTEYSVVVHSRPSDSPSTEVSLKKDKELPPWLITFENLLTPEECEAMIQLGYKYKYKRSRDVGARKFDGTHEGKESKGRTSENAWCSVKEGCRNEDIPKRLHERAAKILGIPPENSEDFQILKYEKSQFYNTHHDYIPHHRGKLPLGRGQEWNNTLIYHSVYGSLLAGSKHADRQCGPRILTFFFYLSDVEAAGGTDFPALNITVQPKTGRAVLWPSVYDSRPFDKDDRLIHQALPVEAGIKFGANGTYFAKSDGIVYLEYTLSLI
jgi:prolyl 4-hydroxylase